MLNLFKKVIYKIKDMLLAILNMSLIPRIFYLTLVIVLSNIAIYRVALYPKLITLLSALILSEVIRISFHDFIVKTFVKLDFVRNVKNTFDPIAVLILLGETILNAGLITIVPMPVTFWTKPLNVNLKMLSDKKHVIFLISFAKSIASIYMVLISFFTLKYLSISKMDLFSLSVGYTTLPILKQFLVYSLLANINFIVLGLIPLYPFDMGIALEHLASFDIRKFVSATRPHGSLIMLILFIFGLLPTFVYSSSIYLYNVVANLL